SMGIRRVGRSRRVADPERNRVVLLSARSCPQSKARHAHKYDDADALRHDAAWAKASAAPCDGSQTDEVCRFAGRMVLGFSRSNSRTGERCEPENQRISN